MDDVFTLSVEVEPVVPVFIESQEPSLSETPQDSFTQAPAAHGTLDTMDGSPEDAPIFIWVGSGITAEAQGEGKALLHSDGSYETMMDTFHLVTAEMAHGNGHDLTFI